MGPKKKKKIGNLKHLNFVENETLISSSNNLEDLLKCGGLSDIDGRDLFSELKVLKDVLPNDTRKQVGVLNYLKTMDSYFPNA